jgi:O-antigen/teichoic acid export membrane protein
LVISGNLNIPHQSCVIIERMWSRFLRANFLYALGSAANSAALFLLVPFLVNSLSTAEYGAWSLYEITTLLLTMITLTGMDVGMMREYWFLPDDDARRRLAGTIFLAVLTWGVVLNLLVLSLWSLGSGPSGTSQFTLQSLIIVCLTSLAEALFSYLLSIFRIREQPAQFVILNVTRMVLYVFGAVVGVRLIQGVEGALIGRLSAGVLGLALAFFPLRSQLKFQVDRLRLRKVLRYSLPLLPANLASYVLIASDRYVMKIYLPLETIAVYSFAYKIASSLDILITRPFAIDWAARRYQIAGHPDAPRKYANVLLIYLFVILFGALGLLALAPTLYRLLAPPEYLVSLSVLPVLILAMVASGLAFPLNIGIVIKDKTPYVALVGITSALVCLALEFWLIPRYGMAGAAWATLLAYLLWTTGVTFFSLRFYPIPYHLPSIAWILLAAAIGFMGLSWVKDSSSITTPNILGLVLQLAWLTLVFAFLGWRLVRRVLQP